MIIFRTAIACALLATPALCACSGCAETTQTALLPGDSGPCTTINETALPDGGYVTTLVPCNFQGK